MSEHASKSLDRDKLAWGALFIWWGISEMFTLPAGVGLIGVGLILIGVNLVRVVQGVGVNGFSLTIAILALVWGGLQLAGAVLSLPFELPVFAILLIVLGLIILFGGRGQAVIAGKPG